MTLAGKSVLITGANRGIGEALVEQALRRGAVRVYAATRRQWTHSDPRVQQIAMDLTNRESIHAAAAEIDTLDVLVNNAGIAAYDDLSDAVVLQQHLAVNLFGTLEVTQAFLPALVRAEGSVVNVASTAGLAALPFIPSYSISKAAILSMSQAHRALFATRGVRVHAVVAGPVDTEMSKDFMVPKASADSVAAAIFDGVARGDDEIFPDPAAQQVAEAWSTGASKVLERSYGALSASS